MSLALEPDPFRNPITIKIPIPMRNLITIPMRNLIWKPTRNPILSLPQALSDDARDLLRRLLTKDPATRIGLSEVAEHPWIQQQCPPEPDA